MHRPCRVQRQGGGQLSHSSGSSPQPRGGAWSACAAAVRCRSWQSACTSVGSQSPPWVFKGARRTNYALYQSEDDIQHERSSHAEGTLEQVRRNRGKSGTACDGGGEGFTGLQIQQELLRPPPCACARARGVGVSMREGSPRPRHSAPLPCDSAAPRVPASSAAGGGGRARGAPRCRGAARPAARRPIAA